MGSPSIDEDRLDEIVGALVRALSPRRVILFGSRARGDARPDSDLDLLLVVDTDLPLPKRLFVANKAVRDFGLPIDLLVLTPEEVERLSSWSSSVVPAALREGRVLHEAA